MADGQANGNKKHPQPKLEIFTWINQENKLQGNRKNKGNDADGTNDAKAG